jgi:histidinol-phosphate/aromatic aminotransferase/cobyric acid decarboxylase-like protein
MPKRHKIIPNESNFNLIRNECLFPSIANAIISGVNVDVHDIMRYHSSYEIEALLSNKITTDGLIFCNFGSEYVIKQVVECLSQYSKRWVIPQPTFELTNFYCEHYDCTIEKPEYTYTTQFSIDLSHVQNTFEKILYIVSPHNPTGVKFSKEELEVLCKKYMYVIVDEAYISPDDPILNSFNNLIFVRSFSKMGGLTGLRFGFGICFDEKLFSKFNKIRPMYLNAISLKYVEYILNNNITTLIENKIDDEIIALKKSYDIVCNAGNFALLRNTQSYNGYGLKPYKFSNQLFYRITLCESNYFFNK